MLEGKQGVVEPEVVKLGSGGKLAGDMLAKFEALESKLEFFVRDEGEAIQRIIAAVVADVAQRIPSIVTPIVGTCLRANLQEFHGAMQDVAEKVLQEVQLKYALKEDVSCGASLRKLGCGVLGASVGHLVKLVGLEKAPVLNGKVDTVIGYNEKSERYIVEECGGEGKKRLREVNHELISGESLDQIMNASLLDGSCRWLIAAECSSRGT